MDLLIQIIHTHYAMVVKNEYDREYSRPGW